MVADLVRNWSKMCKIMHNPSGFRLSACRLNTRKKAMKPIVNTENHCLIFDVGVTGLEPATTRPPDAYANQLRHTPNRFFEGFQKTAYRMLVPELRVQI